MNKRLEFCRVYWGHNHACVLERGHKGHHFCECSECKPHLSGKDIGDEGVICVGSCPYYASNTFFYGEDAETADPAHLL